MLDEHQLMPSYSKPGYPYDNAVTEVFLCTSNNVKSIEEDSPQLMKSYCLSLSILSNFIITIIHILLTRD